jgi:hypothetical protein
MKYTVNLTKNGVPIEGKESLVSGPNQTTTVSGTAVLTLEKGDLLAIETNILQGGKLRYVGQACSVVIKKVRVN